MAETFKNQVDALTGFAGTEDDALSDWLTAAAKEIINILPPKLKEKCVTATGVGTDFKVDLDGLGEILYVTRENADSGYLTPCRKILSMYGGLATDSSSLYYATVTDPVYWIDGDNSGAATLYVKPTPTANQPSIVHHIAYPAVAHGDGASGIANFPDEAEYLVVLYVAVKALQRLMNDMKSVTDIDTTAFEAINTELDETQGVCDKIDADLVLAKAEIVLAKAEAAEMVIQTDNSGDFATALTAINTALDRIATYNWGDSDTFDTAASQLTRVKDALNNAEKIIDDGASSPTGNAAGDAGNYLHDEEDIELVQGALGIASTEIKRAQIHITEWQGILNGAASEAQGFANEVQARTVFTGAKLQALQGYISTAQAYAATAQGFGNEIQAKVNIAQGYIAEANTRMARETQKYQWYQAQQVKLQQDYDKGIQMLVVQGIPQPVKQERAR